MTKQLETVALPKVNVPLLPYPAGNALHGEGLLGKLTINLVAHLELAYLINDLNDKAVAGVNKLDEDDWRVGLTFQYKF